MLEESTLTPLVVDDQIYFEAKSGGSKSLPATFRIPGEDGVVYGHKISLDTMSREYHHIKYRLGDFMSDVGGVLELFVFLFGIFLYPLSSNSFLLRALKKMYRARTQERLLLRFYHDTEKVNPATGAPRKEVRFDFDAEDENKIMDVKELKQSELGKTKPIVLSTVKKFNLYMISLCNPCKSPQKVKKGDKNANLIKLYEKGQEKLLQDFDVVKLMKNMHHLNMMYNFYRLKHSDLMVEVNSSRKKILNLEDDGWSTELEKP